VDISVRLAFDEGAALRLLNWLAQENARIFQVYDRRARERGERLLPPLYASGVVYEPEEGEVWSDYLNMLIEGHEDCDALAAVRAGELLGRGWRALTPRDDRDPVRYPGDEGYAVAQRRRPASIAARVVLSSRAEPDRPGLYHCIVEYKVPDVNKVLYDDPSARLGMLGDPDSPEVQQGLTPGDLSGRTDARIIRGPTWHAQAQRQSVRRAPVDASVAAMGRVDTDGWIYQGALRIRPARAHDYKVVEQRGRGGRR
jgi:hypothetical protein